MAAIPCDLHPALPARGERGGRHGRARHRHQASLAHPGSIACMTDAATSGQLDRPGAGT